MKKILVITPATHFKNQGAAQKDIFATVKMLKELGYEVALYTIHSPAQFADLIVKQYQSLGVQVNFFEPKNKILNWLKRVVGQPALFDRAAAVFADLVATKEFKKQVTEFSPNLIFSFCSYSWPVLKFAQGQGIKSIFRSHNFESSFFWEALSLGQKYNPLNWLRFLVKWCGEYLACRYADKIATLPFGEIDKYEKWQPGKTTVWTLAFLAESIRPPREASFKAPLDLFFLGASYNVVFHRRGVELLITKIAPAVLAAAPGKFRFHICGGKLPEYLAKQCDGEFIIYEGYVPDLEDFLSHMDAGVFPVMTGRTMKGKIFETLCRAFPMVIPTIGRGGYQLRHDKEVLLADSVSAFTEQILRLTDPELRYSLSKTAAAFADQEFTDKVLKNQIKGILEG